MVSRGFFKVKSRTAARGLAEMLDTISQSIGGTGVSPVQAQAKACGYHKLLFDCNSVSWGQGAVRWRSRASPASSVPKLELGNEVKITVETSAAVEGGYCPP